MERRILGDELSAAMRDNTAKSYVGLAMGLPGTRLVREDGFYCVVGGTGFAFGDFAAGFDLKPPFLQEVDWLARVARGQDAFWVFCSDGDRPKDMAQRLLKSGFELRQELRQLVWQGEAPGPVPKVRPAWSPERRQVLAEFATRQFFSNSSGRRRSAMALATVNSPHELYSLDENGQVEACAMVVRTPGCLGVYNLCVEESLRRRGLGKSLVTAMKGLAAEADLPLFLQCEPSLSPWYLRQGFVEHGELSALAWRGS
ncbi:MAG: GNAT family N-acetyltransferase [Fimbriimonadaceae bacterium]|nr:GNAT family N-acetyltransferase [Fimbriimonadaceae bacterium]QYK56380.1 MAG: GNAT family N-acetyltransferase [Fimbriimonadaceae bacterium]